MGTQISLIASDGFKLGGYRADPTGSPKGGLSFAELKRGAHINPAARAASYADFPRAIRVGRPGFEFLSEKSSVSAESDF